LTLLDDKIQLVVKPMGLTKSQKKRLASDTNIKMGKLFMLGIISSKDVESVGRIVKRALNKIG